MNDYATRDELAAVRQELHDRINETEATLERRFIDQLKDTRADLKADLHEVKDHLSQQDTNMRNWALTVVGGLFVVASPLVAHYIFHV